jgi:tRNA pseudouridine38-40 synthase
MSQRYFVQLSYNGTCYHGWQVQPNAPTVQEELNKAFSTLLREQIELTGAGRTDTGVHARNYMAHFDSVNEEIAKNSKFLFKLNSILPADIAVHKIFKVNQGAHARFDAVSRTYLYNINQQKDPFLEDVSWYLLLPLDLEVMNHAAALLISYSDFTSFSKLHSDNKTNICKIEYAHWTRVGENLVFTITADRFLRNMVRAIVGTLVNVGYHKITIQDFINIIESKDRGKAGASAPAKGLFLHSIKYKDF